MRHENAVSEVIGAVLLIGVVMLCMAVIGVIMLSTPPPEESPKSSLTSYCVRCDLDNNYEIIIYHGGGESMNRNDVKFFLFYNDSSQQEIDPWWVYQGTPEDCMFSDIGDSSLSTREYWATSEEWKGGETLRFRVNVPSPLVPVGLDIRYYPFKSPMVKVNFKDKIKNSTCVENYDQPSCDDPTDEIVPVLINPRNKGDPGCNPDGCAGGMCQATFTYSYNDSSTESLPLNIQSSWNYFSGNTTPVPGKLIFDGKMKFSNEGNMTELIQVNFSKQVQWKLGRTLSEYARCE